MTRETQFTDLLTDWLEDQPDRAPSRVLQAVLTDLQSAPQRARWKHFLRRFIMFQSNALRYPVAVGAVVLMLAVGGLAYLNNEQNEHPQALPSSSPGPIATPKADETPVADRTPTAEASVPAEGTATPSPTNAGPPKMSQPRIGHTATRMDYRGRVYVVGGFDTGGMATDTVDVFDPRTDTFSPSEQRPGQARAFHTATLLFEAQSETNPGACVLFVGGYGQDGFRNRLSSAENYGTGRYIDVGGCSQQHEPSMHAWRVGHTATLLTDGRVLVIGGNWEVGVPAEIWQPDTGLFTDVISPTDLPSGGHTATVLEDGIVLIAGYVAESVEDPTFPYPTRRAVAYLFDPETGTFLDTGDMQTVRQMHEAVRLHDGTVLLVGEGSAEIFDPSTGRFAATAPPSGEYSTMTLLDDGRVLLTGGSNWRTDDQGPRDARDWAAVFDPEAGLFRDVGPMTVPREWHSATLLEDGRVIIAGGYRSTLDGEEGVTFDALDSFEFFDPSTNSFYAPR